MNIATYNRKLKQVLIPCPACLKVNDLLNDFHDASGKNAQKVSVGCGQYLEGYSQICEHCHHVFTLDKFKSK